MIIEVSGRNDDVWLRLANESELVHVSAKKELYNKGFDDYHSYDEGDSIIKKANSNEFTIKNGENKAIYLLGCEE
jgi:hypothetical protein